MPSSYENMCKNIKISSGIFPSVYFSDNDLNSMLFIFFSGILVDNNALCKLKLYLYVNFLVFS